MSVIRAFIAVNLTPEIQKRLDEVISQFKQQLGPAPVRWVPPTNIHLTLKFLGDVSLANLKILTDILQTEAAGHRAFEISVGGVGAFPSAKRPRVIWVGIEAPQELSSVQNAVEQTMSILGYDKEDRPYSPHLTLGRVSRNANSQDLHAITKALEMIKVGFLGATLIKDVHLYKSDLNENGATYTRLFSAPLSG